jgi:hypothetical protein
MRRNANKVKELTAKLRMCACSVSSDASLKEWSGPTARHSEQARSSSGVKAELCGEEFARRCALRKAEAHRGAAATDGWHQRGVLRRREDDVRARRRLFERLQQCVLRRLAHTIGALNKGDATATLNREKGEALLEFANWRDPDLICRAGRRDQCKVGVTP